MPTGYSGTPLAKKLGVIDGQRTWRFAMPASVAAEIARKGASPLLLKSPAANLQMAHLFVTRRSDLAAKLARVRRVLVHDGIVWVSWPKKTAPRKAAKVPTDITEDTIRAEAFPLGLVDIKVCAVDEVWSGLKLVIRKSNRLDALPACDRHLLGSSEEYARPASG
jgi:hypothetical protein